MIWLTVVLYLLGALAMFFLVGQTQVSRQMSRTTIWIAVALWPMMTLVVATGLVRELSRLLREARR